MSGDLGSFKSLLLSEAVFCADCEMISNSRSVCLCCGSSALLNLSQLLGGSLRNVERAVVVQWTQTTARLPVAVEFPASDSKAAA